MIYQFYQASMDILDPVRLMARATSSMIRRNSPEKWFGENFPGLEHNILAPYFAAGMDLFVDSVTTHKRPPFGISSIKVGNRDVAITETPVLTTPFGTLLRFSKDTTRPQPKVLLVAPMSGHFATLLRGTVRTLLRDHDVYITDWHNGRDIPVSDGPFGFDQYIEHIITFLEYMGPKSHVVAVCQPAVAVLAAVAVMAKHNNKLQPRTMTLMAGPIDTRLSPTKVNELAKEKPIEWFEKNLIGFVPLRYPGAMRRVYPGFMQLTAFMAMNLDRHSRAHIDQWQSLATGDTEKSEVHRAFYEEYFAVMDLPAEFYLETVERVFQTHELPLGKMSYKGELVEPSYIRRTALFTVEGEHDDICAIGQTMAALDLCSNLSPAMKRYHLQTGVGHYGVFNGKRWGNEIYPQVREFIQSNS